MVFVLANMTPVVPDHAAEAEGPEDCADAVFAHNAIESPLVSLEVVV